MADSSTFRSVALGPYAGTAVRREGGAWLFRCDDPLGPYPDRLTDRLLHWAALQPEATFLAKREAHGHWRRLTYREALDGARRIGTALLDRQLSPDRPLMILSGNDIEHGLLVLGALHAGVPFVPLSPAYSLSSGNAERVRHAVALTTPGLVYASNAAAYGRAIESAISREIEVVTGDRPLEGRRASTFASLMAREPDPAIDAAHAAVGPDTITKFLFTSGSTQLPKAVINNQRMLCSNQVSYQQCYPFLTEQRPVMVDWLPWHHCAGGNTVFGMILFHGGTLYIDDGRPTPDGMAETLRNLREIETDLYYTVPKGLEMLLSSMKQDSRLRATFFRRLQLLFPVGSSLPLPLKAAFDDMALRETGTRIAMTMGLGMTETAPFGITAHLPDWEPGLIGLPAPGNEVKLAPSGDKLEVRYRGPNVTPGYWRQPELTAAAFDDEGYFRSGDAARFVDAGDPARGLRFDGRIAEDFKLLSGTWVNVGVLRTRAVEAGAPYVQDVVLTGHDRDCIGMMVVLLPSAATLCEDPAHSTSLASLCADPGVRRWAQGWLDRLAASGTGSSNRIVRAVLLTEPPSMDRGEMTDKGSLNQRLMLKSREALVHEMHADAAPPQVLVAAVETIAL